MLQALINSDISWIEFIVWILAVLVSLMFHESAHALAAYALGDPTARSMGRVSFNPLKHVEPVGLLMLIIAGFGWAKPVPVDARYFKKPKRDMGITAAAGPLSNFLLAFICLIIYYLIIFLGSGQVAYWFLVFFYYCALINVGLGVFNLFPVPPLDGSKIFGAFLPDKLYYRFMRIERYGMIVLVILLVSGVINGPLTTLRSWIYDLLQSAAYFLTSWLA